MNLDAILVANSISRWCLVHLHCRSLVHSSWLWRCLLLWLLLLAGAPDHIDQGGPGSVTVWGWNGSSGSGFRFWRFLCKSGGTKRDKLKGTNARNSQFFADFRRFLLIFAFPGNYSILEAQIFAENRRKPQIFAENRRFCRNPFVLFSLSLLVPP